MAVLMTPPYLTFFDNSTPGIPLAGGLIYTYAAGTSTPKATFTDNTEAVPATNPIVLDAQGRATPWISGSYKFVIYDALGNLIRTTDGVTSYSIAAAATNAYFQTFSGDGATTVFTVSQDLGTDENALFVDVDAGGGKGYDPLNPNAYTINGTTLTFASPPAAGTNNIFVRAPLTLLNAASAAAAAAATSETNAAASAVLASQWATLTSGIVATTDYSAKAWAIGGTGITTTASAGAAKEWATTTGGAVDTSEYSSKEYAIGTTVAAGSSKDWATKTSAAVNTTFSAKEYAQGTQAATGGSAKNWASQTGADVTGASSHDRSAKSWAQENNTGATLGGSAKDWAQSASLPDGTSKSSKSYAADAATSATAANSIATGIIDTSTTSLAIGTGAKTFTVTAGKLWQNGQFITAASAADNTNYMHGTVTSYSGTTLITNITDIGGSGTKTDWNLSLSGSQGATGATGAAGSVAIAPAGGTVDAITATVTGVTLADQALCAIVSAGANTSATPTFAPNSLTAHTITTRGGAVLVAGDIGPAGFVALLEYNLANTRWELLNPLKTLGINLALTDVTTNNASTANHGLMPKLSNSATLYFDSLGTQTNPALNAVLTGYTSGAGTVAATDTVLQAIQKLNGNAGSGTKFPRTTQTSTYAPTTTDNASEISFAGAGGNATWTIVAGATNGAGWYCIFNNPTLFNLTVKVTTNTIDGIAGATGFIMYPGEVRMVYCNGTNYFTTILKGFWINTTTTFTFSVPPGYQAFDCEIWGGGGGGSFGANVGGGGGGGYNCGIITAANMGSTTQTCTVGAGGASRTAGGQTSIGSLLSAFGGGAQTSTGTGGGGGGSPTAVGGSVASTTGGTGGGNQGLTLTGAGGVSAGASPVDGVGGGGGATQTTAAVGASSSVGFGGGGGGGSSANAVQNANGGHAIYGGGGGGGSASGVGGKSTYGGNGANGVASGTGAGAVGSVPGGGGGAGVTTVGGAGGSGQIWIRGIV